MRAVEEVKQNTVREILLYLIGVAQNTEGAEVWRALFAEMLTKYPEAK